jgi:hypothetical protein
MDTGMKTVERESKNFGKANGQVPYHKVNVAGGGNP